MIIIVNPGEIVKINNSTVVCKLDDEKRVCYKCCFNDKQDACQKIGCLANDYPRNKGVYFEEIEVPQDYTAPIDQLILNDDDNRNPSSQHHYRQR